MLTTLSLNAILRPIDFECARFNVALHDNATALDKLFRPTIDPVCLFHGKRASEHVCLYCCLCFETLTPEECWVDAEGIKWDKCVPCADFEAQLAETQKWADTEAAYAEDARRDPFPDYCRCGAHVVGTPCYLGQS